VVAEYAGSYRLRGSNLIYRVTANTGTRHGKRSGKPAIQLHAELKDVFFVAGQPRVRLIFQRDASNRVTGYVSRREGRDVVWEKVPE
jgi:hypothetical protein